MGAPAKQVSIGVAINILTNLVKYQAFENIIYWPIVKIGEGDDRLFFRAQDFINDRYRASKQYNTRRGTACENI